MKRILTFIIAFLMMFSLIACDKKGGNGNNGNNGNGETNGGDKITAPEKGYKGMLDWYEGVIISVDGDKVTIYIADESEEELENGKKVVLKNVEKYVTKIISNENGVIVFNHSGEGTSFEGSLEISGEGAADYKKEMNAMIDELFGDDAQMMKDMIAGKVIKSTYGDELWDTIAIESDNYEVKLNDADMTFEHINNEME